MYVNVCVFLLKVWLAQNCPSSVWHDTSVLKEKTLIARDWLDVPFMLDTLTLMFLGQSKKS